MITEKRRQNVKLEHQIIVHMESLYFRRALETCLGSGKENTSLGRVFPSRGSKDSVNDDETRGGFEGRSGCWCWYLGWLARMSWGGEPPSLEVEDLAEGESEE